MSVEHPSGEFSVELRCDESKGDLVIKKAGLLRTARILCKGEAYYPSPKI